MQLRAAEGWVPAGPAPRGRSFQLEWEGAPSLQPHPQKGNQPEASVGLTAHVPVSILGDTVSNP